MNRLLTRCLEIALVTGASQGFGKTMASRLSQDDFNLAMNDILEVRCIVHENSHDLAFDNVWVTFFFLCKQQ